MNPHVKRFLIALAIAVTVAHIAATVTDKFGAAMIGGLVASLVYSFTKWAWSE